MKLVLLGLAITLPLAVSAAAQPAPPPAPKPCVTMPRSGEVAPSGLDRRGRDCLVASFPRFAR